VSSHGVDRSHATLATSPESLGLGPAATDAVVWLMVLLPLGREDKVRHDPESGSVLGQRVPTGRDGQRSERTDACLPSLSTALWVD